MRAQGTAKVYTTAKTASIFSCFYSTALFSPISQV